MNSTTDNIVTHEPVKFGYIYKITNLVNGKFYIGSSSNSDGKLTGLQVPFILRGIHAISRRHIRLPKIRP